MEIYSPCKWPHFINQGNKEITKIIFLQIEEKLMATELLSVVLFLVLKLWTIQKLLFFEKNDLYKYSITCSTKIVTLAIAPVEFISVGILCEFAMLPGV